MFQSEDSGNDSDTSESSRKRKRFDDAAIERRMERRKWEENRCDMCLLTRFSTKILVIRLANGGRSGGRILNGVKLWFPFNNFSLLWHIHTKLAV